MVAKAGHKGVNMNKLLYALLLPYFMCGVIFIAIFFIISDLVNRISYNIYSLEIKNKEGKIIWSYKNTKLGRRYYGL